jgi:2',3'-cyclic-nucleotide 2'-phosphodiesterase (5'-nucleotidase family)
MRSPRPAAAIAVSLTLLLAAAPARADVRRLVIVHTNDLHGHLLPGPDELTPGEPKPEMGGIAAVAAFVAAERAKAAREGAGFLYLDAGDLFHGSPEGDATRGLAVIECLDLLRPDAVTIGNHEFACGVENLAALARAAHFPLLSANMRAEGGMAPFWRDAIETETGGLRVAVVGLTTDATPRMNMVEAVRGIAFEKPARALRRWLDERARRAPAPDLVIALTHLGSAEDERLAAAVTGCAVIVGGHDHVVLEPARAVGETLVVQAGEHMRRVGRVVIDYDTAARRVVGRRAVVLNLGADAPRAPEVAVAVEARRRKDMDEVCGEAGEPILRAYAGESEAGALVCEAIRAALGTDLAIVNHSSVRGGFARGWVTRREVYECVPFQNPLVTLTLSGKDLAELIEEIVGRRGEPGVESAGLLVRYDPARPAGERVIELLVNGAPLDPSRAYRVGTTDFFASRTEAYPALAGKAALADTRTPCDALVAYFGKRSPLGPPPVGRIVPATNPSPGPASASSPPSAPERGTRRTVEIEIVHTNDVHGQVYPVRAVWSQRDDPPLYGGYAALASLFAAERRAARAAGRGFILLDAGDCFQGTPEGNLTEGRLPVEWMNLVGYDAMAIGNHEFDAGAEALPRLAALARFPWLSANMRLEASGRRPEFARAVFEEEVEGVKVAVIGLTTEETKRISMPRLTAGYAFEPALDTARREVAAARARGAEVVVLLTHCGSPVEEVLAASVAGVDAVIGGHTHTPLAPRLDPTTGALVTRAEAKGVKVGRVRIVFDRAAGCVVERSGELIEVATAAWAPDPATEKLIASYAPKIAEVMDVPLGITEEDLVREPGFRSSRLGSWVCDVMREAVHADAAITNKGGLRADIPKGPIRVREVYQVSPFGNTVVTLRLTGRELREELEYALSKPLAAIEVSGLEVRYDLERPPGDRLIAARLNGEPLSPDRKYLIATNSFLAAGGDGHRILAGGEDRADTGLDVMRLHADDVKRRGVVRLGAIGGRIAPAESTIPAEKRKVKRRRARRAEGSEALLR